MSTTAIKTRPIRLTFGGLLRSEWIKFWSLRSTYWCILIIVVLSVGIGLLISTVNRGAIVELSAANQQATAVGVATAGTAIGELVFAVLGALIITGEYGTGMIRSTLTADPRRIPTLFAKAIVLAITAFVVGLVTIYGTAAITFPLLAGKKVYPNIGEWKLNEALIGGAVYLVIIALIAFSIGAIVRVSAGGIAASLGLILVVPTILDLIARLTGATWAQNLTVFAPTSAGAHLFNYVVTAPPAVSGIIMLDRTTGGLVTLAWFVVLFVVAAVLLKRRDA